MASPVIVARSSSSSLMLLGATLLLSIQIQFAKASGPRFEPPPKSGISLRGNSPNQLYSFPVPENHEFRCFQSNEELRKAVQQYESYKVLDEELATKYGWPISNWCVSQVTDFSNVFANKYKFNEPLTNWDTRHATSMKGMFQNAYKFNQDLSHFNTSRVVDMSNMFTADTKFVGKGLEYWDTSSVASFDYMFMHAHKFIADISHWHVNAAKSMVMILKDARSFPQHLHLQLLAEWDFNPQVETTEMTDYWDQTARQQALRAGNFLRPAQSSS